LEHRRQQQADKYLAELQRSDEKHLAELQRSSESNEAVGQNEVRAGRFLGAERILRKAVETLGDETRLEEPRARIEARRRRVHGLAEFYRLADEAERLAFLEYDREALAACDAALEGLGILKDPEWPEHMPQDDLKDDSFRQ